jgi:hypothetical protein
MTGKNVDAILGRIGTENPPTHREMGFLLPELERRKVLIADTPQHCCKRIACFYQFRGQQYLWVGAHLGYGHTGKIKLPESAVPTANLPAGFVALTRCRQCGDSFVLWLDPGRTIVIQRRPAPIWTEVAD